MKRHQTQWAAQFAVASELCKRGYEVSFTLGNNTPVADLMVISPGKKKEQFLIDVKGLAAMNYWQISRKPPRDNLFYVLAFVPKGEPNQFFILTQQQVGTYISEEFARTNPELQKQGESAVRLGVRWIDSLKHADCWCVLPK